MTMTKHLNGIDLNVHTTLKEAGLKNSEATKFTFSLNGMWSGGCKMTATTGVAIIGGERDEARSGRFTLISDEPIPLGSDAGANPVEYILQGLAGCYIATISMLAARKGIELETVKVELEADLDLAGFFGVDSSVRPGANQIRIAVYPTSKSATHKQLQELVSETERSSAIRDTLIRPIDVVTRFCP